MMTRCFNRIMVEPKARPLSIKARVRIDYFPINTDLDSDYSYYTPNAAVVTAVCGSIYKILRSSSDTLFKTNMYFVFTFQM